jgi:hypothetical protein
MKRSRRTKKVRRSQRRQQSRTVKMKQQRQETGDAEIQRESARLWLILLQRQVEHLEEEHRIDLLISTRDHFKKMIA